MKTHENTLQAVKTHENINAMGQRGFTIIELMISLMLGLLIMAGISQIFITSKTSYSHEDASARAQEGGRFSMEFIASDIRMAGYLGCNSSLDSATNNATPPDSGNQSLSAGLRGFTYIGAGGTGAATDWDPPLPAELIDGQVEPWTDVITIQYASSYGVSLTGNMATDDANIQINPNTEFRANVKVDDILMVADCSNADIFRVTSISNGAGKTTITHTVSGAVGNDDPKLGAKYGMDAELMRLVSHIYYIGRPDYDGDGAPDINALPALQRLEYQSGQLVTVPVVEGIEKMRILFGRDTNQDANSNINTPDTYNTATEVNVAVPLGGTLADGTSICAIGAGCPDWGRVAAVRLGFISVSENEGDATPDTNIYHLLGDHRPASSGGDFDDYGPATPNGYGTNSRRRRIAFTSTVQLRN
ncbi:MAG: hypothetical protein BMS9Abin36_1375 [Gammaproteobacteria bacterium]|nr:MAG: hypothetical protein BMS9Abin36_1375 [Gammaproteobacteria bacterium]